MSLETELELRRGMPYSQILAEVRGITSDVLQPIEKKDLRDIVTVLASGLDYRLQQAEPSPLRSGLTRAFNSMNIAEFGFNLTDPVVAQLLDVGVNAGLIDVNERLWFYAIATKQVPTYPNLTLKQVIEYFDPTATNVGDWTILAPSTTRLMLNLAQSTPELAAIRLEQRLSHDGVNWTNWDRISPIIVQQTGIYYHTIPVSGMHREIRWRGEQYRISGTLEAV